MDETITFEQPTVKNGKRKFKKWTGRDITLFVIACMGIAFLIVFSYIPMAGILLAFKADDSRYFNIFDVIDYAPWAGFANFEEFFNDQKFWSVVSNTLGLNLLMLLINFPAPIIFALLLNERIPRQTLALQ